MLRFFSCQQYCYQISIFTNLWKIWSEDSVGNELMQGSAWQEKGGGGIMQRSQAWKALVQHTDSDRSVRAAGARRTDEESFAKQAQIRPHFCPRSGYALAAWPATHISCDKESERVETGRYNEPRPRSTGLSDQEVWSAATPNMENRVKRSCSPLAMGRGTWSVQSTRYFSCYPSLAQDEEIERRLYFSWAKM